MSTARHDLLGLVLIARLTSELCTVAEEITGVLVPFFDKITLAVWPRYKILLERHFGSIQTFRACIGGSIVATSTSGASRSRRSSLLGGSGASGDKSVTGATSNVEQGSVSPHIITRRYAELTASLLDVNRDFSDDIITQDLQRLRTVTIGCLQSLAFTSLANVRLSHIFMINNIALVEDVLKRVRPDDGGSLSSTASDSRRSGGHDDPIISEWRSKMDESIRDMVHVVIRPALPFFSLCEDVYAVEKEFATRTQGEGDTTETKHRRVLSGGGKVLAIGDAQDVKTAVAVLVHRKYNARIVGEYVVEFEKTFKSVVQQICDATIRDISQVLIAQRIVKACFVSIAGMHGKFCEIVQTFFGSEAFLSSLVNPHVVQDEMKKRMATFVDDRPRQRR